MNFFAPDFFKNFWQFICLFCNYLCNGLWCNNCCVLVTFFVSKICCCFFATLCYNINEHYQMLFLSIFLCSNVKTSNVEAKKKEQSIWLLFFVAFFLAFLLQKLFSAFLTMFVFDNVRLFLCQIIYRGSSGGIFIVISKIISIPIYRKRGGQIAICFCAPFLEMVWP